MKILFLDQSGKLAGAELSLLDVATHFRDRCRVATFQEGKFPEALRARKIPTTVLGKGELSITKDAGLLKGLTSIQQLWPLIWNVARLSKDYDIIYVNTQKAFVVGAIASLISRKPLVYHLRDILSPEHFSRTNLKVAVTLANRCATKVIANSQATEAAFVKAGGRPELVEVIYNGFNPEQYSSSVQASQQLRQQLDLCNKFVIGHFSRLSPWKGQHVLIDALQDCSENVVVLLVGDALFGEDEYAQQLKAQVQRLGLQDRVHFLGFRADIPQLMSACDLVAHTSTAPEPFGRVIVEAMFCGTPVIAAKAGGALELVEHGRTGWLAASGDAADLARLIQQVHSNRGAAEEIAQAAHAEAHRRFSLAHTNQLIQEKCAAFAK